jgi:hypothetical protein
VLAVLGIFGLVASCGGAYVGSRKDMELLQKDRELLEKDLAHEKDLREVGERYLQLYVKEEVKDHVLAFLAEGEYELLRQVKADRVEKVSQLSK